jgi:hypothetical protein
MANEILEEDACIEMGLVPLEEAGGVISWIKRAFSNVDNALVNELREQMARIKTKDDKRRALDEIDDFLDEARMAEKNGLLGDALNSLGIGTVGGAAGAILGAAAGAVSASGMHAPVVKDIFFRKTKQKLADAANKASQFGTIVNGTVQGLTIGAISLGIIAITLKTVNRYSGSLDKYVAALQLVRDDVAAMKVE